QVMKNIATLDFSAEKVSGIDNYLDLLDKRDRERANAASQDLGGLEGIGPEKAVDALAESAKDLAKKAKEAADALKAEERAAEALAKADMSRRQTALKNAQAYFAAERTAMANRMKQLESTKITSMEVGSEAAVKYLTDLQNKRLANSSRPEPVQETQQELLAEAQKQYGILVASEKQQKEQVAL